ncbi:MAG: hypothetical protein PUI10_05360 [Prevotellaceae bacterium]|nr:hypothetical protein [Prevotellaceae bacterium]MDD7107966.1 hypothetical protein [Prevotellaceae bacterium]MDY3296000.1 hypothetical protein [Bacteroidaceae bacterium]
MDMRHLCIETDKWLRRRIRMCIWKVWKLPKTRIKNLMKCGIREDNARHWGYCKGYWGMSGSPIMHVAASMENLSEAGYPCMQESHLDWNPK